MGAGLCDTDGQLSPVTAQLYASSSLWANHNGPEEANGNEACPLLANRERGGVAKGNSSGGKNAFETRLPPQHRATTCTQTHTHAVLQLPQTGSRDDDNISQSCTKPLQTIFLMRLRTIVTCELKVDCRHSASFKGESLNAKLGFLGIIELTSVTSKQYSLQWQISSHKV